MDHFIRVFLFGVIKINAAVSAEGKRHIDIFIRDLLHQIPARRVRKFAHCGKILIMERDKHGFQIRITGKDIYDLTIILRIIRAFKFYDRHHLIFAANIQIFLQRAHLQRIVIADIGTVIHRFLHQFLIGLFLHHAGFPGHTVGDRVMMNDPNAVRRAVNITFCAVIPCLARLFKRGRGIFRRNGSKAPVRHKFHILRSLVNRIIRRFAIPVERNKACRNDQDDQRKQNAQHNDNDFFLFTHFLFFGFTHPYFPPLRFPSRALGISEYAVYPQ